jgi:hypothetical protein
MAQLIRENVKTKAWVTKAGVRQGNNPLARGRLYICCVIDFISAKFVTANVGILGSIPALFRGNCGKRFKQS